MLNYYQKFCKINNWDLQKADKDFLYEKELTNVHLLNDKLKHIRIATYLDDNIEYYNTDLIGEEDEYYIFIPIRGLTNVLMIKDLYNLRLEFIILEYSLSFEIGEIKYLKRLLKWIDIDELTSKISKVLEYLLFHLRIIHNINLDQRLDYLIDYVSDKNNNFERDIDYYVIWEEERFPKNTLMAAQAYNAIYYYDKLLQKRFYMNRRVKDGKIKYMLDSKLEGGKLNDCFYFSVSFNKSLLICLHASLKSIYLLFFQDNKIVYDIEADDLSFISPLLHLVNRDDINIFFEKIDYLKADKWKEYVERNT